jgi:protease I
MRIACVLASGFEDSEFRQPFDAFRRAGHDVTIVGLKRGEKLRGKRDRERIGTDKSVEDVAPSEFDALFIPGGHSPDVLRADRRMVAFTRGFADKPILSICHGPQLLMTAKMVAGRRMTAWKTVQPDLACCGATVVDEEVVIDGNLLTSRQPDDLPAFTRESLRLLEAGAPAHA